MLCQQVETTLSYGVNMHETIEPTILYFGTPVLLIGTLNEDGSYIGESGSACSKSESNYLTTRISIEPSNYIGYI
jgi:flavin reductase (DIM6/NTAB) family NADH-FMN oxidoreductase RutF